MKSYDCLAVFADTAKPCKGEFHIDVYRNGTHVDSFGDHNLVVEAGRIRLAELASGLSTDCISQIGVGDGAEPEKDTDTALSNPRSQKRTRTRRSRIRCFSRSTKRA